MDYPYVIQPFVHQLSGSKLVIDNKYFAIFDEMGTGKTKTIIDAMGQLYYADLIDTVVVVCPNIVKGQWANPEWGQIVKHTPDILPYTVIRIESTKAVSRWVVKDTDTDDQLIWIVVNYEALRVARIQKFVERYIQERQAVMVLDESSYINKHTTLQAKACMRLGLECARRYILNGTPGNPMHYFSQFNFLHPSIIDIPRYTVYRNRYAVMGGYQVNNRSVQIVGYQNLKDLYKRVEPFYRRVTAAECLDLPDKLYQVIEVPMAEDQDKLYKNMKDNLIVQVGSQMITAHIVLTKILRLAQLSSGFISDKNNEETVTQMLKRSPKAEALIAKVKELHEPTVIFCMYRPEIEILKEALKGSGIKYDEIHGDVKNLAREEVIHNFQEGMIDLVICQIKTGGMGIELTRARYVMYMSNHPTHRIRSQSEGRVHRNGVQHPVLYIDFVSTRFKGGITVDHTTRKAVKSDQDLAEAMLNGGSLDGQV